MFLFFLIFKEEILNNLSIDERGPYQYVFLQECERMNTLVKEMKRSLHELHLGLVGELTMSERMETLQVFLPSYFFLIQFRDQINLFKL